MKPVSDQGRTAPVSAPLDTQALPKWIDDHKGADPFMDDVIAYIESMHSQYAERIRQLERERAAPAWAAFADNGNVIIWSRNRSEVEPVAAKYDRPVEPILAYIDGRTTGREKT